MPRTYALADIHGRLDLLQLALRRIRQHAGMHEHRLIFLGDLVDRGPDSAGVLDLVSSLTATGAALSLRGNHEQMMLDALQRRRPSYLNDWLTNGGDRTLASYGAAGSSREDLERVPHRHTDFLASLPHLHMDCHRVFVHAGVLPDAPLTDQHPDTFLWIRERFLRAPAKAFAWHIVHGHTPLWDGKPDAAFPERLPHRTNLDTGAWFTGVLTVGVFDDSEPGPVGLLPISLPPGDGEPSSGQ